MVAIILLWCGFQSWNQVENSAPNKRKYFNRNFFLWKFPFICNLWPYTQLKNCLSVWPKYLNTIVLGITHLVCDRQSCSKIQNCTLNSRKYYNRNLVLLMLVWIIHLFCALQLCKQIQIYASNLAKYFNGILLWIIYLLYHVLSYS